MVRWSGGHIALGLLAMLVLLVVLLLLPFLVLVATGRAVSFVFVLVVVIGFPITKKMHCHSSIAIDHMFKLSLKVYVYKFYTHNGVARTLFFISQFVSSSTDASLQRWVEIVG